MSMNWCVVVYNDQDFMQVLSRDVSNPEHYTVTQLLSSFYKCDVDVLWNREDEQGTVLIHESPTTTIELNIRVTALHTLKG